MLRFPPLVFLALFGSSLAAQTASPYVPAEGWVMPYVEHLIRTGVLDDPAPLSRPFRRADLLAALQGRGQAEAVADPGRVSQIIRILIDNALTHTPEGTKVTVTAVRGERVAELIVGNAGAVREDRFQQPAHALLEADRGAAEGVREESQYELERQRLDQHVDEVEERHRTAEVGGMRSRSALPLIGVAHFPHEDGLAQQIPQDLQAVGEPEEVGFGEHGVTLDIRRSSRKRGTSKKGDRENERRSDGEKQQVPLSLLLSIPHSLLLLFYAASASVSAVRCCTWARSSV